MAGLLLDTCAAIWLVEDEPISEAAQTALDEAHEQADPLFVSPISAWEVGLLAAKGRLTLSMEPLSWFQHLLDVPGLRLAAMSPPLLIASSFLPGTPPRDPADRIIVATARLGGYRLLTRDSALLAYSDQGHVQVVAC